MARADLVDVMRRMKLLGFNAIRMPFSFQDLYYATPRDFQWQYCTNVDGPTFLTSVTNPSVSPPAGTLDGAHTSDWQWLCSCVLLYFLMSNQDAARWRQVLLVAVKR